ncbi:TlpA family protein disulfide reductase [Dietzia maris]
MTRTRSRRVYTLAALCLAAVLVAVLAVIALNRGNPASTMAGDGPVEITSVDGEEVTVPSDRPTMLYFMASWCATCIPQATAMDELEEQYADRVRFVAVDVTPENTKTEVDGFRTAAGAPEHPYVVDETGQLTKRYGITSLDSTVVVAPDGEVLDRADGTPMKAEALRAFLDGALS